MFLRPRKKPPEISPAKVYLAHVPPPDGWRACFTKGHTVVERQLRTFADAQAAAERALADADEAARRAGTSGRSADEREAAAEGSGADEAGVKLAGVIHELRYS